MRPTQGTWFLGFAQAVHVLLVLLGLLVVLLGGKGLGV